MNSLNLRGQRVPKCPPSPPPLPLPRYGAALLRKGFSSREIYCEIRFLVCEIEKVDFHVCPD